MALLMLKVADPCPRGSRGVTLYGSWVFAGHNIRPESAGSEDDLLTMIVFCLTV